eukprot:scaffold184335_cov30-Tisochrysis_lutea.AAC.2
MYIRNQAAGLILGQYKGAGPRAPKVGAVVTPCQRALPEALLKNLYALSRCQGGRSRSVGIADRKTKHVVLGATCVREVKNVRLAEDGCHYASSTLPLQEGELVSQS